MIVRFFLILLSLSAVAQDCVSPSSTEPAVVVDDYFAQVANRPASSTPTIKAQYLEVFDAIAYAGALGIDQQGGLPHPHTTAPDAINGLDVEYGTPDGRTDFYLDGVRPHTDGLIRSLTLAGWDRGAGTIVLVYEHIAGEAEPLNSTPDLIEFNGGRSAALWADRQYFYETRDYEAARRLRLGGNNEGTNQLTWTGLPDNWDGKIHIEIVSWSQVDSYLIIDGVDYGSRGGLSNAGVMVPVVDSPFTRILTAGTPRLKFIYGMFSTQMVDKSIAFALSADLFDWAE